MNFELLTSEKNKPMLTDSDNCLYWKIISRGKRTYWRCIHYRTGRAVTFDRKCEITSAHNHYGDKNHAEMKRFQGIVQKQALSSKDAPRSIIGSALKEVSNEAWVLFADRSQQITYAIFDMRRIWSQLTEVSNCSDAPESLANKSAVDFELGEYNASSFFHRLLQKRIFHACFQKIGQGSKCEDALCIAELRMFAYRYLPKTWNVRDLIKTDEPKTSNELNHSNGQMINYGCPSSDNLEAD
uniref:FLYWCH-type domain-containing protein n=1 Tax=Ditylenchus dipsaci TaxID=166011 RepID=A0A915DWY1_9BILA